MSVELTVSGCEVLNPAPLVIKNVKDYFHMHTYGGLTPFFEGLHQAKLMGTRCSNQVRAWFRTENPTHAILDLAWVPAQVYGAGAEADESE